jgi:hypothetical protein
MMESRETFKLQLPIKRIYPIVAKVHQKIAIYAEGSFDAQESIGPTCLPKALPQIV